MRRLFWLLLLLLLAAPAALPAQYFGQNKVTYGRFDFRVLETEHFDIYYYPIEREAAYDVSRMAERSYARLSRVLRHNFIERKPIILYASHSDFTQTNTSEGEVGEGTGGFTDFLKHRNVIPLTGAYADIAHVLQHEMTHQFQYDIWSGGKAGAGVQTLMRVNPPLWFVEGMAEYLSIGRVDANTAMWIRDAAAEGRLPTIMQLETDPRIFPYRFGQSILTYIGARWGDEAIGAILTASRAGSVEEAFLRVIGLNFRQLGDQWRDAMQKQYLPELAVRNKASAISDEVLSKAKSKGTLHLAPALSPDGKQIVFFSEKDFFFIDMWLANVSDGVASRRLFKSTWSSNYETFRFINSGASWSPDGQFLAFAAKRGPKDDIVVLDVAKNKEVARITVSLSGITSPTWSPDGKRLAFTGYDGGLSDLFIVDVNGKNLKRLTHDRYADLHPAWSPDGKNIAFTTDRGPGTNFDLLTFDEFRLALYHIDTGEIEVLAGMDAGKNVNPQWAPDGASLAFVSDRTGVANIFLYDLADHESYQLTDFYTGAQGITPLSPILSWARASDKLAYVYYQDGDYDVYVMSNPRGLKKAPWREGVPLAVATDSARAGAAPAGVPTPGASARYRGGRGEALRRADSVTPLPDSLRPALPLSIAVLMDSATLGLPDTATFAERPYSTDFALDYAAQPTIGYTRDTFGRGVYGGATVTLSDMLGNKKLIFSGYINGRPDEAQLLAAYANVAHRVNWAVGLSQDPYFWYYGNGIITNPEGTEAIYITQYRRMVYRSAFLQTAYPISRFRRLEGGLRATNIEEGITQINQPFDPQTGYAIADPFNTRIGLGKNSMVQPSLAMVFDNTLGGYVGPYLGRRSHFEISKSFGDWSYSEMTFDYRRYAKLKGPLIFATRGFFFGRQGRDANRFTVYLGTPELLRGYTSGSYGRNECINPANDPGSPSGCPELDQLVGTSVASFNAELRFPLLNDKVSSAPRLLPPIEGAVFFDAGMAWDQFSTLAWSRPPGASPRLVRTPLMSIGGSLRTNVFGIMILRFDYAKPVSRPGVRAYWTISLGPTF